jgi:hypothetical protein
MTEFRHLTRKEIEPSKWDACVEGSGLGIAFGYSHYLDIMADDWEGLVAGDYEAVLPLPTRRKFGIRYAYPPRFMGPHPVYAATACKPHTAEIIRTVGRLFPFSDIQIVASAVETDLPHTVRRNHMLSLHDTYETLRSGYRPTCRNLLSKATGEGITVQKGEDPDEAIRRAARDGMMKGCSPADLARFRILCRELVKRGNCFTLTASSRTGEPLSMAVFFTTERRLHYMASWTGDPGRRTGASRLVLDSVVKENAGTGKILDFVGSDIPGIASFFEGFGAVVSDYLLIRQNRLPTWMRWMKPPLTDTDNR